MKTTNGRKIFVYGTLLEGFGNWSWALNNNRSVKLGEHVLNGSYTMVSCGGFPAVINHEEGATNIHGEVYEVEDDVYSSIEMLEGYPHHYQKETIETPWGEAEMYVQQEDSLNLPKVESGSWREYRENY